MLCGLLEWPPTALEPCVLPGMYPILLPTHEVVPGPAHACSPSPPPGHPLPDLSPDISLLSEASLRPFFPCHLQSA